jgi:hypothetical protein
VRDAICKHVSFRPSILVHVPVGEPLSPSALLSNPCSCLRYIYKSDGKATFQLEFHIPFFALRKAPQTDDSSLSGREKRLRSWEEISLLTPNASGSEGQENYRLHKAQISCVIHGCDEWNWTAWAFEDTYHKLEESDDTDTDVEADGDEVVTDDEANGDEVVIVDDPIAHGLDANTPIWRPREYFMKTLEIRIHKVREEWDKLVYMLQLDRNRNVCYLSFDFQRSRISN